DVQETLARVMNFEFVPCDALAAGPVHGGDLFPVELGEEARDELAFGGLRETDEANGGVVEVSDAALFIDDEDAIFDGIEERFKEGAFARESFNDRLQSFLIEPGQ